MSGVAGQALRVISDPSYRAHGAMYFFYNLMDAASNTSKTLPADTPNTDSVNADKNGACTTACTWVHVCRVCLEVAVAVLCSV